MDSTITSSHIVKYDSKVYRINEEIIRQIGILSGLLDAQIEDLELPKIQTIDLDSRNINIIHGFLEFLENKTSSELDIMVFILSNTSTNKLKDYIENIKDGKYTDNLIREINTKVFILLKVIDYWDFGIMNIQIRDYISQFIKICDLDTIKRWLGGII